MSKHGTSHHHLVLVPGFVGFDALGSLRYYSGVTSVFADWRKAKRSAMTLHYFDNFPTASVRTRAERLRSFLAKKIVRGEIATTDWVTLVGHSTGGLDIRELLQLLIAGDATSVDDRMKVPAADILRPIRKLVFLSVPHYGSNIADYISSFRTPVMHEIGNLRDAIAMQGPLWSKLRSWFHGVLGESRAEILLAIADTLAETDGRHLSGASQGAREREARYELLLWLDHMANDFGAIDDLRSAPTMMSLSASPAGHPTKYLAAVGTALWKRARALVARTSTRDTAKPDPSPAHYDVHARKAELASWPPLQIRSYATFVPSELVANTGTIAFVAELARLSSSWTLGTVVGAVDKLRIGAALSALAPGLVNGSLSLSELTPVGVFFGAVNHRPTLLFEVVYALCARFGGPFEAPDPKVDSTYFAPPDPHVAIGKQRARGVELNAALNDGIVNTLSMFWPRPSGKLEHELFLVQADHADIIGHHSLRPKLPDPQDNRLYDAYDIFESQAGFRSVHFEEVWRQIFAFAAT